MHSVHSVGFFDVAPNQQLIVSSDPSFSSLSFLEITANRRLTPLDLTPPVYNQNVNACCFSQESSVVAASVGDDSLHLWDVHTHLDISCLHCSSAIRYLERSTQRDTWMGCMGSSLVEIDPRSNTLIPRTLSCPITSFSQSPSSPLPLLSSFTVGFLLLPAMPAMPPFSSSTFAVSARYSLSFLCLPPPLPSASPGVATLSISPRIVEKTALRGMPCTRAARRGFKLSSQRPCLPSRSCLFTATHNTTATTPFWTICFSSATTRVSSASMTLKPRPSRAPR